MLFKNLIVPALCYYAYNPHYAQNYASIIHKAGWVGSIGCTLYRISGGQYSWFLFDTPGFFLILHDYNRLDFG